MAFAAIKAVTAHIAHLGSSFGYTMSIIQASSRNTDWAARYSTRSCSPQGKPGKSRVAGICPVTNILRAMAKRAIARSKAPLGREAAGGHRQVLPPAPNRPRCSALRTDRPTGRMSGLGPNTCATLLPGPRPRKSRNRTLRGPSLRLRPSDDHRPTGVPEEQQATHKKTGTRRRRRASLWQP